MLVRSSLNQQYRTAQRSLAERLLTIPLELTEIELPGELVLRAARELGRELAAEVNVGSFESEAQRTGTAPGTAITLGIHDRDLLVTRMRVRRAVPFTDEERRLLKQLAHMLGRSLTMLSQLSERRLLTELNAAVTEGTNLESAAQMAIQAVLAELGAEAGALLQMLDANARSRVMAMAGTWPADPGVQHHDVARGAALSDGPVLYEDNLVAASLSSHAPARFVLLLRFPAAHPAPEWHFPALRHAALLMAPHLERHWNTVVLARLFALNNSAPELSTNEMYDLILDSAIELIPGADSGTLLVRRDPHEPFTFKAARGFEHDVLVGTTLDQHEAQAWYGPDLKGWQQGKPRLVRRDQTDIEKHGLATTPSLEPAATRYDRIEATICLPVLRDGNILAILNVENQQDLQALGRDSLEIIQLFGSPLAGLLHRQHVQDLLRRTALIDELTGLANRRAFDEAFKRELARSARDETSLSVLLLDMKNFKDINDSFGHEQGDRALVAVTEALKTGLRDSDVLSRWGGDEFAIILADASAVQAAIIAERLRQAVAAIEINGINLKINVGFATSPYDGELPAGLLRAADEMMYADKHRVPFL